MQAMAKTDLGAYTMRLGEGTYHPYGPSSTQVA